MQLSSSEIRAFRDIVWLHYRQAAREMPWRGTPSPYKVLVSELMLQQTQVTRVIPKFDAFMYTCEDFASLAAQPLSTILQLWSGLGYNRRAKFLHQTAQVVMREHNGELPSTRAALVKLPGIGENTAGAILAYAFNQPVTFVETNVRTVLFHHFFPETHEGVSDKVLRDLAEQVLDTEHPREWHWALMDYGAFLKKTAGGRLQTSRHYKKQTPLKGSLREMRGQILKRLAAEPLTEIELHRSFEGDARFELALSALISEGFIEKRGEIVGLTGYKQTA